MAFRTNLQKFWRNLIPCVSDTQNNDTPSKLLPTKPVGGGQNQVMAGAHDFVINQLNVGVKEETDEKPNALKELKERSITGAEFNSAERDPPPRCHPGTRTSFLEQFRARVEDAKLGAKIIWMHGPAGVGKSAIMQSLVEEIAADVVCATLFFSRPNHRDNPRKAFTTLAYRLAVADPEYCQHIGMRLKADPTCLAKSLDDQFKTLFVTPFVENHTAADSRRWVMFLDGLDECQNTEDSDNQCRILNLISDSVLDPAVSLPLVWVIASRPEENLKDAWSEIRDQFKGRLSNLWELVIPADSDQASRDVELYLHQQFEIIRKKYSKLMPVQSRWPSDSDFLRVAKKSSGLFVFASTVVRYVSHEDPVYRLKFIISLIERKEQHPTASDEKPFNMVDLLYSSIMSDIPKRLLPAAKSLIGFYHLEDSVTIRRKRDQKIGLVEACNILGLQQNEAYAALRKLQSVLICPSPETAQVNGVQFFHASFPDFLLDQSRSQKYHVDLDQEFTSIWRRYAVIIKESITVQEYAGINISWLPDNNPSLLGRLQKQLLQTSRHAWVNILTNYSPPQSVARTLQVDVPEMIEAFRSVGLAFMGGDEFPIERFLSWLNEVAPTTLREMMISQRFTLTELDTERLFKSLCVRPRYQYIMNNDVKDVYLVAFFKDLDTSQWAQARAALWAATDEFGPLVKVTGTETTRVMVVGMEPSKSYAIIGPFNAKKRFYILPYYAT